MLSILIPTYNYDITALVHTLHQQCLAAGIPFEITVRDDGSSNKQIKTSNQTINNLVHCKYTENTKNQGRTATRNKLAAQATYKWLLFLDADVIPASKQFIANYITEIQQETGDVVFGGITYQKHSPKKEQLLRWHYGKHREAKTVAARNKSPYFIISQNLLIRKDTFQQANVVKEDFYGLDNLFSSMLKKNNVKVTHINNPVIHLGLEKSTTFITKALKAVETTVHFEQKNMMTAERPLQKAYLKLKKWHLTKPFCWGIAIFEKPMRRNFLSKKPSLFLFDLYRLYYYAKLKNNA
ncbi:glycosyltransferase family 2 protein [Marixanthomonas spongiae]|uniref:Glycosyl transferase n=1 Tax=Marixanthomonas spongiae TaxID=2174845 RepID=A0A2U0I5E7_9FLAO|nr:glycosyltransferase family 2 protein [Marixanthomonas spongiae]PVW16294.1 glycosyl transferase [Marixanthomonas spongiae]